MILMLNRKRRDKRRHLSKAKYPLEKHEHINQSWSMDFMNNTMVGGRRFRTIKFIDDCTREALAIEIDAFLLSKRIIRTLKRGILDSGKYNIIRTNNGPELTSKDLELWAIDYEIKLNSSILEFKCKIDAFKDSIEFIESLFLMNICFSNLNKSEY